MIIFISYAHEDAEFANMLATKLIERDVNVWLDRWELHVGDSLTQKINLALKEAAFLCVLLSPNSVNSEWCKTEINTALLREQEEKRSILLPVVIADCKIPEVLGEKLCADFREDFNQGFNTLMTTISTKLNDSLDRVSDFEYHTDIAVDWGFRNNLFEVRIDAVSFAKDQEGSILTRAVIRANNKATKRCQKFVEAGLEWFAVDLILDMCTAIKNQENMRVILSDNFPIDRTIIMRDEKLNYQHDINVSIRRLGQDTGRDILFNYGRLFDQIVTSRFAKARNFTPEQKAQASAILGRNPVFKRRQLF